MTFPTYSVSGLICNYYKGVFTHEKLNTAYLSIVAWTMEAQVRLELTIKVLQTSSLATWILCHIYIEFRTPIYCPTIIMLAHCIFFIKVRNTKNCYHRLCKICVSNHLILLVYGYAIICSLPTGLSGRI